MKFFQGTVIHISFCFTLYLWHRFISRSFILYIRGLVSCAFYVIRKHEFYLCSDHHHVPHFSKLSCMPLCCIMCKVYILHYPYVIYILCCANIMYLVLYVYHTYVIRTLSTCRLSFVCAIFSCYVAWYFIVFQRLPATNETDNACNCGAI